MHGKTFNRFLKRFPLFGEVAVFAIFLQHKHAYALKICSKISNFIKKKNTAKIFISILFYSLINFPFLEASPSVDASIDAFSSYAHFPTHGTITVTHRKKEKIDIQSFTMGNQPLNVSFVKDTFITNSLDTLVSIYSFQLPAQDKGLYVLPSISVKIENQMYHTTPSTYEIRSDVTSSSTASLMDPVNPLIFSLEASIQGPSMLYIGERTKLFYRIVYNQSIDLTRSILPMIHPKHFRKIGDVQIRDYQSNDANIQELVQEIEASELGTFSIGPSLVEGYSYIMQSEQKIYDSHLLKAEAPEVILEVKPFPLDARPASFSGALGKIQIDAHLISSPSVKVGDKLLLQVEVQGISNLADLGFPPLVCQPGFNGFFQMDDLPPLSERQGQSKIFYIELHPLNSLIQKIPSIEVSSFDPIQKKYIIQHTPPIPVTVLSSPLKSSPITQTLLPAPPPTLGQWPLPTLSPLELKDYPLETSENTTHTWFKNSYVLLVIPIACFLLLLQKHMKKQWQTNLKLQISKSEELFQQALRDENLKILEQAFWQCLWEKGIVPKNSMDLEKILIKKDLIPITTFIVQLQSLQYSSIKNFYFPQIKQKAKKLFTQIKSFF